MKLSDYIMEFLESLGVRHVFYLPGGGSMHMNDSLGKSSGLNGVCMLHEQAASFAAESCARISGKHGVCLVTSGPGSTNALSGLAAAWLDSTPVIFISGQVKRADLAAPQGVRQFGIQEIDIISIVKSMTKYAVQIDRPEDIKFQLEKAAYIAVSGRPGPVWLDVPLDVQSAQVDIDSLRGYGCSPIKYTVDEPTLDTVISLLNSAKRPLLMLGHGIRLAKGEELVETLVNTLNIPVLTSWNGVDLIHEEQPLYYGRPGAVGHRHANFIMQNCDFLLTIGTRLNLLMTGFDFESFANKATHVMVDIDENELNKKSVRPKIKIACDATVFIQALLSKTEQIHKNDLTPWFDYCNKVRASFPMPLPETQVGDNCVNTYDLIEEISQQMTGDDIYQFTSSGTSADIAMQTFKIKKGQRAFLTKGLASMGYDLPACIGSCLAGGGKRTVCVTGDGGVIMNIQELATLHRLQLPVKLFVIDNGGYSMIYSSQHANFDGRLTGCTKNSGLSLPDIRHVAQSFGIKTFNIEQPKQLPETVKQVLDYNGPAVCRVRGDITQKILPRQANYILPNGQIASHPLSNMAPFLENSEF